MRAGFRLRRAGPDLRSGGSRSRARQKPVQYLRQVALLRSLHPDAGVTKNIVGSPAGEIHFGEDDVGLLRRQPLGDLHTLSLILGTVRVRLYALFDDGLACPVQRNESEERGLAEMPADRAGKAAERDGVSRMRRRPGFKMQKHPFHLWDRRPHRLLDALQGGLGLPALAGPQRDARFYETGSGPHCGR